MTPKISILVPIYNVADFLPQALQSLLTQTLTDLEIICINDGSTDRSLQIIKKFQKSDSRISIIDKSNSGYGDSMNLGLKRARGEYVGILEPDDWVEPDAYERLCAIAAEHHADVVKANYFRTRTTTKKSKKSPQDARIAEITQETVLDGAPHPNLFQLAPAIWSAIYRRDFLRKNKITFLPTPGASYQDLSFSFKVWALSQCTVLIPDAFVHYRIDNANSSVNNPGKVNCVIDEYAEIETFLCERGIFPEFGSIMTAAKFRNYHWNFQRLSPQLAKAFFQTWRQEFLAAREDQLLDRTLLSRKDWTALQTILKHPHLAYRILRLRLGLKRLFRR